MPYCNAQLASFSRASDELAERDARVVALSVDDEATSAGLAEKHRIPFPLGHRADASKVAAATGAFTHGDPIYLQSTGFVLGPEGRVLTAVYSSGAIGRLVPDDAIGLIDHVKSTFLPRRGGPCRSRAADPICQEIWLVASWRDWPGRW